MLAHCLETQLGNTERHRGIAQPRALRARHQADNLATTAAAFPAAPAPAAAGAIVVVSACCRCHRLGKRTAVAGPLPAQGSGVAVAVLTALTPPAAAAAAK